MKKKLLIPCLILIAVCLAAFLFRIAESVAEYKVMNHSEQLKSQLVRENLISSPSECDVRVNRPWYSLNPEKWVYEASWGDPPRTADYTLSDRGFSELES